MKTTLINSLAVGFGFLLLQGCSQYLSQPIKTSQARLGAETPQYKELVSLPEPKEKIVAAVYKFRDQTGQYKNTEGGTSWSTAVTQGATSILLRAMEESGWFIPIEREGLSNLLNERKIIRSSMANYNEKDQLPPLVFAGVILEGGIISFDSNILTGGVGARYFGSGASTKYREDRVTIYLRVVSASNGRILKTVYTSKTILSQQVDVGVFRFVSTRRLLEAETGFTFNEPGEMAVKEAIEKAVFSLVVEGITDQLWLVKNEADTTAKVIEQYVAEEALNKQIDVYGNRLTPRRSNLAIGIRGSGFLYEGDYTNSQVQAGGELNFELKSTQPFSYGANMGIGQTGTSEGLKATLGYIDAGVKYKFLNLMKATPYARVGVGLATELKNNFTMNNTTGNTTYPKLNGEVGMELLVTPKIGLTGSVNYHLLFSDGLDRLEQGKFNDSMWGLNMGLMFYLDRKK